MTIAIYKQYVSQIYNNVYNYYIAVKLFVLTPTEYSPEPTKKKSFCKSHTNQFN